MSAETPWGRPTWRQPRKRIGSILPMYEPKPRTWWPLWSALAAFLFFAALVAIGHGLP